MILLLSPILLSLAIATVAAHHQIDIVRKADVTERPPSDEHRGVIVLECIMHDLLHVGPEQGWGQRASLSHLIVMGKS